MKGLGVTPQQSGDLMLGFRGILIVRYRDRFEIGVWQLPASSCSRSVCAPDSSAVVC